MSSPYLPPRDPDRPRLSGQARLPTLVFEGKPLPEDHPGLAPNFAAKAAANFQAYLERHGLPPK